MTAFGELVGRSAERELLSATITAAAAGRPAAVVLHGEPGVGKTRLVTDAVETLGETPRHVLWARCLRFGTDGSAFLPIAQALSRWLAGPVHPATRAAVLHGTQELSALLPELGPGAGQVTGGRLMTLLATVVHRIAADAPTVLVADDLQWADTSSLDLLAYLITGFRDGERLTLLGTYRDTELPPGHGLHGWVADMRRMPGVTVRRLAGLDRLETASLIRRLSGPTGPAPDPDVVFERSRGNPYLTELILGEADDGGGSLREALLATWHRLSPTARTLTQVLAVGGSPVPVAVLEQVVATVIRARSSLGEALAESGSAGVVVVDGDTVWFRHPLLAEVVAGTVDARTVRLVHDVYITTIQAAEHVPDLVRAGLLALHHEAAGHPNEAFTASLHAAQAAALVFATAEESQHLERACRLWERVDPEVRDTTGDHAALLEQACLTAQRAGRFTECEQLSRQTLGAVDPDIEPLRYCRLLMTLPFHLGDARLAFRDWLQGDAQYALDLALPYGPSDTLALAYAHLARAKLWQGSAEAMASARADTRTALEMAEAVGSTVTLALAHLMHSQFHWSTDRGLTEAAAAWQTLREHGTVLEWGPRANMYLNCLAGLGDWNGSIDLGLQVMAECTSHGAPTVGAHVGVASAGLLVRLGRYDEGHHVLREVHTRRQDLDTTAEARVCAAGLALRLGALAEADEHLARVEELWGGRTTVGTAIGVVRVEQAWTRGEWGRAMELVACEIGPWWPVDPDTAEELLVWATRAAADLAEARAGNGEARSRSTRLMRQIEETQGTVPSPAAQASDGDTWRTFTAAMLAAERARLWGDEDQPARWANAGEAALLGGFPWESAWAAYQRGRALLKEPGRRPEARSALREAHRLADGLGARPLVDRVTRLARQARITLDHDDTNRQAPTVLAGVALTGREAEVLGHLVAGRTYGEIARALFISEKTVSVHVSNLLHKTGTRSRVELAELAARPGAT